MPVSCCLQGCTLLSCCSSLTCVSNTLTSTFACTLQFLSFKFYSVNTCDCHCNKRLLTYFCTFIVTLPYLLLGKWRQRVTWLYFCWVLCESSIASEQLCICASKTVVLRTVVWRKLRSFVCAATQDTHVHWTLRNAALWSAPWQASWPGIAYC